MKEYTLHDKATFYFVIDNRVGIHGKTIAAWSDDKTLVDYYMAFHSCKSFSVKKISGRYSEIMPILNENTIQELGIYNLSTLVAGRRRVPEKVTIARKKQLDVVSLPMTLAEMHMVADAMGSMFADEISWDTVHRYMPQLKKKYIRDLKTIGLDAMIQFLIYNKRTEFTAAIIPDQIGYLYHRFRDTFE